MPNHSRLLKAIRLRTKRHTRTPYYVVDLPSPCVQYLISLRTLFVDTFGRDYEDEDPQFWDTERRSKPYPDPHLESFISSLADAMRESNHHPAHVYAVTKTRRLIYGCGTCIDKCDKCNFREVPNGWTLEWQSATQEYEKWAPNDQYGRLHTPPVAPGFPRR